MAVPNNTSFSLQDVIDSVAGGQDDLIECFAEATASAFDGAYSGSKNSLLNFRNYEENTQVLTVSPSSITLGASTGNRVLTITSTNPWTASVTIGGSWIAISPASGSGNGSITVSYLAFINQGRNGNIRITSGSLTRNVFVSETN